MLQEMLAAGSGGGGKYESDTITLTVSTEETISLPFEPKNIVCKFYNSGTSDSVHAAYSSDVDTQQFYVRNDNVGQLNSMPPSGMGYGAIITDVGSYGFKVKTNYAVYSTLTYSASSD